MPYWMDSVGAKVMAAAALVVVLFVGFVAVSTLVGGSDAPPLPPVPDVKPYDGPVSWAGQRNAYDRLKTATSCLPDNASSVDRPSGRRKTIDQMVHAVAIGVGRLRGHEFTEVPPVELLSEHQLQQELEDVARESYEPQVERLAQRVLVALRAIPRLTRVGFSAPQVAGFYVPDTGELFARKINKIKRLKLVDELTLAHELEHALSDQLFDLTRFQSTDPARQDEMLAGSAVAEGTASVVAMQYDLLLGTSDIDIVRVVDLVRPKAVPVKHATLPYYYTRSVYFPYLEGALFACDLYAIGGWDAVDEAYSDPPTTSAEIMFPSRYIFKIPVDDPTDPPELASPWVSEGVRSLGAADLLWLFQAPTGQLDISRIENARKRKDLLNVLDPTPVSRWNGGEIHVWSNGDEIALGIALVDGGADPKDGPPIPTLCDETLKWFEAAFPEAKKEPDAPEGASAWKYKHGFAVLRCLPEEGPRLGLAPDLETAAMLASDVVEESPSPGVSPVVEATVNS